MIFQALDILYYFRAQGISFETVMKFAMTVRAGGNGVVHSVRTTFGEWSDVVKFKELLAIQPLERCRFFAHFTDTGGILQHPGDHLRIPDKATRRCLASRGNR